MSHRLRRMSAGLPSVPEIRYLLVRLLFIPLVKPAFVLAWS